MPPAMPLAVGAETKKKDEEKYQKGVKHLCENGIDKVPTKYIVPISERPANTTAASSINLPVVDFSQLQGQSRSQLIHTISEACQEYGFFQLINHGIDEGVIGSMRDLSKRFFELPFEEREKHMTSDMYSPVRYGTSYNQNKDGVFCWRDFLKLSCHPLQDFLSLWPSSPQDLREVVSEYSTQTRLLYLRLMEAILESLGIITREEEEEHDVVGREFLKEIENGNQIMVMNLYPPCPEPDLTLGLSPHSDYGLLTLLLQDEQVEGLQIHHKGKWLNVKPIPNSFVVNIGDQLEIYSNGRYKSVLHRVLVNSFKSRISAASLHSLNVDSIVRPSPKLVDKFNPPLYKDTSFAAFLEYLSSSESKCKSFLESRML